MLTEEERKARRRETLRRYNNKPERVARMRQYVQENYQRHLELGQQWRESNREKDRESHRAGYRRNRDARLERGRAAYHRDKHTPGLIVKNLWGGAKRRARERNLEFTLTKAWVMERVLAGLCEISGLAFATGDGMHNPYSPTVDRKDCTVGYTPENCRLVIWAVNNLKGVGDDETMWTVVDAMVANRAKLAQQGE